MSDILHEDTFHARKTARMGTKERARQWKTGYTSTKKGDIRKTVSKRRAYVNTPRQLNTKKQKALRYLEHTKRYYHQSGDVPDHNWNQLRNLVNDI